ncbi:MAG: hypothetical protein RMX68_013695 [Aulosira sp. ZfuVER01]|nr:hypothetical protein [Aulosira sp. ZfuVER01]MDZ8001174.1 hypothetical protein [Aulosira sp. DedVER01a]MDZ8053122.1 hypothetical protein [Aulosira sp. ZfuCHP01]
MSRKLCTQITLLIVYIITLVWFLFLYHRIQKALQWWSYRQSIKLFLEAEKIRDDLLQDSFTIRRNLDILSTDNVDLSINQTQECLQKIDRFHQSLVSLSDRLFPFHLQYSLPLAIGCLLEPWHISNPHLYFRIDLPVEWHNETARYNLIVLITIEELLTMTVPEVVMPISIYIYLNQHNKLSNLNIEITYPDWSTLTSYSTNPELQYLCDSFCFLTSGKCSRRIKNLRIAWYFRW